MMPPSWLLEAVAETQESNGRASASANASNPASKQSTSSRQPEQRIEIPSHRSIPAIRERAEFTSVNQNWSKDLAPNSMNTPMSGSHGHGDSGAGGFDLFKNDVYPDLNEFDRMFSENRSLDMPSATSVSPSLSPGATMETSQRLGADGNIDGAGSDRPPFGLQISEPEKLALRQHLKDQRAPENLGEQLRPLSPGASSSLAADANTTGYCYHGKRSIDLDEAQKTDDPKLLWAIIHSLLESKMKAKQPESNQKMPQLIDMTSMTCKVCGAPTPRLCAGCHLLSYCASEHQAKDWPRHAEECRAWGKYDTVLGTSGGSPADVPAAEKGPNTELTLAPRGGEKSNVDVGVTQLRETGQPRKARALYHFNARYSDEQSFLKGDILSIVDMSVHSGWWSAKNGRG